MFSIKDLKKIFRYRSLLKTIYFNFHYLPLKQAWKLPILLYKPNLRCCKGKIILKPENGKIRHGMVKLGFYQVSIYPNSGVMWENKGGTIIFKGTCDFGNDTYLSFGENALVEISEGFNASAGVKIISYHGIKFGLYDSLGWGVLIMDTNFHPLYDLEKKKFKSAGGAIEIGDHNWFATQCKVMHSVKTPERCIFGMGTVITRGSEMKPYCVMGGSPVRVLKENVIRIVGHDSV
jgi:acetyltransferase-like isoleucine patch superfamily enzyme